MSPWSVWFIGSSALYWPPRRASALPALSEVVNLGNSIIQPFTVSTPAAVAPRDATTKDALNELGRAIGDRAINSIGQLSQELRTDVLFVPQEAIRRPVQVVGAGGSTAVLDAALAKSSDIDISGVKIPIGLLAAPVQIPMRAILGVRMISGAVHVDGQHYVLLVTSNAGDSWRVDADAATPSEAVKSLGDQLAFQLLQSVGGSLRAARVTSSWQAFQTFRAGLGEWRDYQVTRTPASLSRAIQDFRSATCSDTRFALAHYWLALALQEKGQRNAAVAAFRRSIAADPDFTSGYLALAVALSNAPGDYPAAVDPPDGESEAQMAGVAEARWRLHQFISFPPSALYSPRDRAVGYTALCHDAYQAADETTTTRFHLAYFYCARARVAYARLDPAGRRDTKSREAEADIENELAVLLEKALTLTIDDDATFDEIRWDLAQAKKCASGNDERRKLPVDRIRALRAEAAGLLEIVRNHERERGRAVFSSEPSYFVQLFAKRADESVEPVSAV